MNERQLIQRCIRGEPAGWELFVEAFGPTIYDAARYTLRRVLGIAQDEDVENVYQGVLLALCDKKCHRLRSFQGRSSFRTWLTSVTTRFSLNHVRTEKRKGSLKFLMLDDNVKDIPDREDLDRMARDEHEALARAIDKLAERERLLVKLFYYDGLSYKEIGRILRIPTNSISPMLSRAKDQVRRLMKDRKESPSEDVRP
ncbi:MAG: RNA polymerase sigma factor [Planctomycetota bacterium]|jgi:RNA polymerase sigma-70 factor (ECF subfamily)